MLNEFTKARIRRVMERINGEPPKARFRPTADRLAEIARNGGDGLMAMTDEELSEFSE